MVTGISDGTLGKLQELLDLDSHQLADAIGCTPGTLNRWRRGVQDPSPSFIPRLELLDAFLFQLLKAARSRQRAREWFGSRVPALGNHTPRDVFLGGHFAHLVVYLSQHERI